MAAIKTRAHRDGADWVLNGQKIYITNGVMADLYFIAAKTDGSAKGSRGISTFIVEKGTPGFTVAQELDKMGWRSSDTAELLFEDCRHPAGNLLGEVNRGFYAVMQNFQNERLTLAAQAIGECQKGDRADGAICPRPAGLRQIAVAAAGHPQQAVHAGRQGGVGTRLRL